MPSTVAPNRHARRRPTTQADSPAVRRWACVPGAAAYLNVTTRTIRQIIADGRITGYRSSSRYPIPSAEGVDANASKKHLLDIARRLDVRGRSTMDKPELVEAIKKHNRRVRGS